MSYNTMDHAGWAQRNIEAGKQREANKRRRKPRSDTTTGFLAAPDVLSPFHEKVFDIVGMVGGGIYNAPISWDRIQWKGWSGDGIAIPWTRGDLSTFDYAELTRLVFLCHEARIRCEIRSHGFRGFLLCFSQRGHEGGMGRRHPNLTEAVAEFGEYLPEAHRVRYVALAKVEEPA